jgi:hypothetical protein
MTPTESCPCCGSFRYHHHRESYPLQFNELGQICQIIYVRPVTAESLEEAQRRQKR